jgi:hypothetical protein
VPPPPSLVSLNAPALLAITCGPRAALISRELQPFIPYRQTPQQTQTQTQPPQPQPPQPPQPQPQPQPE